jgi:peptidoglycan/xylan/chitin deacetylase (PgdA/CDA1 family)
VGRLPGAPARTGDLTRGNVAVQAVALTFDAHSEGSGAEEILEALRRRGVRVTVFLTGGYIRKYPDLVRRIVADGHEVGNHLNTHPRLTSYAQDGRQATLPHVTREFVQRQLRDADAAFREVAGRPMAPLWRAPYGEHNGEIRAWAAEAGYQHVGWTRDAASREDLDSRDWVTDPNSKIYRSALEIRDRILRFGQANGHGLNGGIVLMHLGTQRRRDQAHTRLPEILDLLAARGYRLVTVSDLLRDTHGPPGLARAATR